MLCSRDEGTKNCNGKYLLKKSKNDNRYYFDKISDMRCIMLQAFSRITNTQNDNYSMALKLLKSVLRTIIGAGCVNRIHMYIHELFNVAHSIPSFFSKLL